MSSPSQPKPITPGQAADAAVGTAGAGELMSIANQPVEQYANLSTAEQLGPAEMKTQQALANQAALQGAQAQQDIQSRVDPMAYAQRQMRLKAATDRLGQLYGQDPSTFSYRAPGAYNVPGSSATPSLTDLAATGRTIAGNLSLADVNGAGADPRLISPNDAGNVTVNPQSYLKKSA
jgi:hypothetical protein